MRWTTTSSDFTDSLPFTSPLYKIPHPNSLLHPYRSWSLEGRERRGRRRVNNHGMERGGCEDWSEQVRWEPAHWDIGPDGGSHQGLPRGPTSSPLWRRRAQIVVFLEGWDRRVCGHFLVPLRDRADRHGSLPVSEQVLVSGRPGHRMGLWRHDLRPCLLHFWYLGSVNSDLLYDLSVHVLESCNVICHPGRAAHVVMLINVLNADISSILLFVYFNRWAHKPGSDIRHVPGEEALLNQGSVLHPDAMSRCDLWSHSGERIPEDAVRDAWWRGQLCEPWLHQG